MIYNIRSCAAFLTALSLFSFSTGAAELVVAKTYPDSPLWPTTSQWDALNSTLSGNLIRASPPGISCYPGPQQSKSACTAAGRPENFENPVEVITKVFTGMGCPAVWTAGGVGGGEEMNELEEENEEEKRKRGRGKAGRVKRDVNVDGSEGGGGCKMGNYPVYVVKAMKREDVKAAVEFANQHGLRLVVKNTGHDFLGRNVGYGSLSIWTHHLRGIHFQDVWKPTVGPPPASPQSAVVIGAGTQWRELYKAAYDKSKIVVGGASSTVGAAGGWPLGGGHGPMSNKYGLGADNILEAEIITPTGQLIIANSNSNPDLYWALRGGGGATFGIVTKLTYKTHPFVTQNALRITITPGSTGQVGYVRGMAYLMSLMPQFADFGMTGYPIMFDRKYDCLFTAPGKTWGQITPFITPVGNALKSMGLSVSSIPMESAINALMGSMGTTANAGNGLRTETAVMSSRLISRQAALNVTNWERVLTTLFKAGTILEPFPVVGGQVARNADMDMALNPAWRKAVIHFSILDAKSDTYKTPGAIRASYEKQTKEQLPLIDEMSVDGAAYFNEATYLEPNWQKTFWGANYPRLVEVKKKYDPNNTLWCHLCVGSEQLVLGQDNKLYRR
ncbi:FAD-binding domain-containing protein [Venturia nashicola]|uniref:FAD-binding domain-containing protein n=1 Tax=Venturia nashicola TaxID=86259 RepID=A0A4Z1P6Y3_9PEZI|nr:FAD-binding domain-containing protein [Venturia nashicola]